MDYDDDKAEEDADDCEYRVKSEFSNFGFKFRDNL
jgi:hypothetical protein